MVKGGGPDKVRRQHEQGKLTARERVTALLDQGAEWLEVGLLVAYDQYDGQAPAARVLPGLGRIAGPPVAAGANDATAKAGSRWPATLRQMPRAPQVPTPHPIPLIHLV